MSRLIAFGCSYTYGTALKDCPRYEYTPEPSKFAWPNLLANKLNLKVTNLSVPGSSNKKIWHKLVSFEPQITSNDIVVISWTHLKRNCVILSDKKYLNIAPWEADSPAGRVWYRFFDNDYNNNLELNLQMSHISLLLNSKGIKNYHFFASRDEIKIETYNTANILNLNFQDFNVDTGSDNAHPGHKSHSKFTKALYRKIKEINK